MEVDVTLRGDVPEEARELAEKKIGSLDRYVNAHLLRARVVLSKEANPRIERSALAEGEILLDGKPIRAHVADYEMQAAVDLLARRLERQLRGFVERRVTERDHGASSRDGEWRHGDAPADRPDHYPRPADERELVRRKSFAVGEMDVVEAYEEMQLLDHDFYLFREAGPGVDAVIYRRDDGRIGVIGPIGTGWDGPDEDGLVREESRGPEPRSIDDVVGEMNELNHRFLYFIDADSGRGHVIYLRYDGNYGLIEPADES